MLYKSSPFQIFDPLMVVLSQQRRVRHPPVGFDYSEPDSVWSSAKCKDECLHSNQSVHFTRPGFDECGIERITFPYTYFALKLSTVCCFKRFFVLFTESRSQQDGKTTVPSVTLFLKVWRSRKPFEFAFSVRPQSAVNLS